jgi:hypothetical protein
VAFAILPPQKAVRPSGLVFVPDGPESPVPPTAPCNRSVNDVGPDVVRGEEIDNLVVGSSRCVASTASQARSREGSIHEAPDRIESQNMTRIVIDACVGRQRVLTQPAECVVGFKSIEFQRSGCRVSRERIVEHSFVLAPDRREWRDEILHLASTGTVEEVGALCGTPVQFDEGFRNVCTERAAGDIDLAPRADRSGKRTEICRRRDRSTSASTRCAVVKRGPELFETIDLRKGPTLRKDLGHICDLVSMIINVVGLFRTTDRQGVFIGLGVEEQSGRKSGLVQHGPRANGGDSGRI